MKTADEFFDQFKAHFEGLEPEQQLEFSVHMTLMAAKKLPNGKFSDLLDAGMKMRGFIFALGILDRLNAVQGDHQLRPALILAIKVLCEHAEKLQARFCNLMEMLDDKEDLQ